MIPNVSPINQRNARELPFFSNDRNATYNAVVPPPMMTRPATITRIIIR